MTLETISLSGKKYPVYFGMNALRIYGQLTGETLGQMIALDESITADQALTLCYCGLKEGARKSNQEFNMTIPDMADLMDENPDAFSQILAVYEQMNTQPEKEEAPKKKRVGRRKNQPAKKKSKK